MDGVIDLAAAFLRGHGYELCLAWTAALMVIYGNQLIKLSKNIAKSWHFLFRVGFFVIVCALGYGLLMVTLASYLNSHLSRLENGWYLTTVLLGFLTLGILAEKKRQI